MEPNHTPIEPAAGESAEYRVQYIPGASWIVIYENNLIGYFEEEWWSNGPNDKPSGAGRPFSDFDRVEAYGEVCRPAGLLEAFVQSNSHKHPEPCCPDLQRLAHPDRLQTREALWL